MPSRLTLPFVVLLVALALPATASAGLPNGSFENGLASWAPLNARLGAKAGGVHGNRFVRAHRRTGPRFGVGTTPTDDLEAGQSVSARSSVRAPRGKRVCIRIRERRSDGRLVAESSRCVRAKGSWQRPPAVGHTVRRGDTELSIAVDERRTARRNRLDVDHVVYTVAPMTTPPAGTVIVTDRSWECRGPLSSFGELPVQVVSTIPNPGNADAIRLVGCRGDGDPATVDLILDVRGNGDDVGTGYDAVKIGQNAHDLVVTGSVACGRRDGGIHQDVVQAMSGWSIEFRDFTAGNPDTGAWTCWGAGGGWYVSHAAGNGQVPTDMVCLHCRIATFNQNMRVDTAVRSGARASVFGFSRSYGIFIGDDAVDPVNVGNRVVRY